MQDAMVSSFLLWCWLYPSETASWSWTRGKKRRPGLDFVLNLWWEYPDRQDSEIKEQFYAKVLILFFFFTIYCICHSLPPSVFINLTLQHFTDTFYCRFRHWDFYLSIRTQEDYLLTILNTFFLLYHICYCHLFIVLPTT